LSGGACDPGAAAAGANQNPSGQELTAAGTIGLMNTGVIEVRAGNYTAPGSAHGARMTGGTVNIGQNGAPNNPTQLVIRAGDNTIGYATANPADPNRELQQANALVKSEGDMNVYLRSDPNLGTDPFGGQHSLIIRGGNAIANNPGADTLTVTALGALQSRKLVLEAAGSILIEGGSSTVQSSRALAESSAVILVETTKDITTSNGGSLILKGGTAAATAGSALNARSMARLDPSKLTMTVDGALVLQGGFGPPGSLTSARIDAGNEIAIAVNGAPRFYTAPSGALMNGSFFMIGGGGSGFYDSTNSPLAGDSYSQVFPITVTIAGGGFAKLIDNARGDAVVQTGLAAFDESLLSYIIFAANEETRAARIRRGIGSGDDLGAPACQ
jgi:hypothetical protein